MKLAFFSIPVQSPMGVSGELNRFLESHVILGMERQFVQDGQNSLWAVCVSYQYGSAAAAADKTSKTDYKEILSEEDFAVYAKLRDLRKELAERDGVPVYAVFNNKQLAEMVQGRVTTKAALQAISGVGKARAEKYGTPFLKLVADIATGEVTKANGV